MEARERVSSEDGKAPAGAGWLPPLEDPGEVPKWTDARCLAGVWREALRFVMGGLLAAQDEQWRELRLVDGWDVAPEPGSDADTDQAIAAKLHIGLRLLTVVAQSQHAIVDPAVAAALPDWPEPEVGLTYGLQTAPSLPASPLFLDFEAVDGTPAAWAEPTWPLPFHLRGAVCWTADGVLSIVPVGSVGGTNPFGGTDYEPWARLVFAPGDGPYPEPGPGDLVVRGDAKLDAWVDLEGESLCAHRVAITLNLGLRVLRVLWLIEQADAQLVVPTLPRPVRRRAARAGTSISAVFVGLPSLRRTVSDQRDEGDEFDVACPIPHTHARLEQTHVLWHEALATYHDEAEFLRKLNPLIESLRTTTMVLQKEISPLGKDIAKWYGRWQQRMAADPKMRWVKERRNEVVHEGHIEKHSKAWMSIVGPQIVGRPVITEVDPASSAHDLVRKVQLGPLDRRVREDGMLVVERRWSVEPFEDEELLDILAHCFAVLTQVIAEAHERLEGDMARCEANDDAHHPVDVDLCASTGRPPCMWGSREARTSRRDLESGAPTSVQVHTVVADRADIEEVLARYGVPDAALSSGEAPRDVAEILHDQARRLFSVDGYHQSIAWLVRDGQVIDQHGIDAGSRRERYLIFERVGDAAARAGADAVVLTGEVWEAAAVCEDDPRAELSATQRDDRSEALVTTVVPLEGPVEAFSSTILRAEGTGETSLGPVEVMEYAAAPVYDPMRQRWRNPA
jgi:hypothetical protein